MLGWSSAEPLTCGLQCTEDAWRVRLYAGTVCTDTGHTRLLIIPPSEWNWWVGPRFIFLFRPFCAFCAPYVHSCVYIRTEIVSQADKSAVREGNGPHFLPDLIQRGALTQRVDKGAGMTLGAERRNCPAHTEGRTEDAKAPVPDVSMSPCQARCHLTPATGYWARGSSSDSPKDLVPGNVVVKGRPCDSQGETAGQWKAVENRSWSQGFTEVFLLTRGERAEGCWALLWRTRSCDKCVFPSVIKQRPWDRGPEGLLWVWILSSGRPTGWR